MSEGAYPLSLYRSGSTFDWDGRSTDSRVVNDEDEHLSASDEGWLEASDYHAPARPEAKRKSVKEADVPAE